MMLIVLDKYPTIAARKLIDRTSKQFAFKQLIELGQLICSTGVSNVYKPVSRGKEIQNWILRNPCWVSTFYLALFVYLQDIINMTEDSKKKIRRIRYDLEENIQKTGKYSWNKAISSAIFRYKKDYKNTKHKTNTELPINEAIEEYEKYLKWKFNDDNNEI